MKTQIAAGLVFLASASAALPVTIESPGPQLVVANADGLIDIAAATQVEAIEPVPSPFRMRVRRAKATREVPIVIEAVLVGDSSAEASAVINGRVYSLGDTLENLTLAAIRADAVDLRQDHLIVRVAVEDQRFRLRLPR